MERDGRLRVAVVGSGMAGLVTAYLLERDARGRYIVKVFEVGKQPSLDSASLSITNPSTGDADRVDLPMRAFAGGFYLNLMAMYKHLGVGYQAQQFLFNFTRVGSESAYFIHSSNNHRIPPTKPYKVTLLNHIIETVYLLLVYGYFTLCCFFIRPRSGDATRPCESLAEYLQRILLPQYFVTFYLLPLLSSVTTCPHESLLSFPAVDLIDYKRKTHGSQHYVVSGGVQAVQGKLSKGLDLQLSSKVVSVQHSGAAIDVHWENGNDRTTHVESFDRVVLAVSPDIVGKIFQPLAREMAAIPTIPVESIIHAQKSEQVISNGGSNAQTINLHTATNGVCKTESVHIQPSGKLVTTCPFTPINPACVIQASRFTRVLRTPQSRMILNEIFTPSNTPWGEKKGGWTNGDGGVWLVGGWCWDGMVLLEGCVVSAARAALGLGADVPWLRE